PTSEIFTLSLHDALPILNGLIRQIILRKLRIEKMKNNASTANPTNTIVRTRVISVPIDKKYRNIPNKAIFANILFKIIIVFISLDRKSTRLNSSHVKISY